MKNNKMVIEFFKKINFILFIGDALSGVVTCWVATVLIGCALMNGWLPAYSGDAQKLTGNQFTSLYYAFFVFLVISMFIGGVIGRYNKK